MIELDLTHHTLIALGIGLLIGAERERRKAQRPASAGLRTFAIAALTGCGAGLSAMPIVIGAALLGITALAGLGYRRYRDSADGGITTEVALVATALLGVLSVSLPREAGALAVLITIMLAARDPLHRFFGETVTGPEIADALLISGATLVVLPMLPDRAMGPFNALNPHSIWLVVIMILAINALGHLATRSLGARLGVPLLGLASGFVSSSATIAAMGAWVRANPASRTIGVAAAILSSVATYVQMAAILALADWPTFQETLLPISAAAMTALACGGWFMARAMRETPAPPPEFSRSFNLAMALGFATLLAVMLVVVAAMRVWFGGLGMISAAAVGGVLDVHAAAISVAAQVSDGAIAPAHSVAPVLTACTTSALTKMVFSGAAGTRDFAVRVMLAQALMVAMAWIAAVAMA